MYELGTKKSTIRTIFEFGRKRAAEVGEENIYDFSLGNPNVPSPEYIKQAIIDIVSEMEPTAIHSYTIAPGAPEVRETLAKSLNERFGTKLAGKNLFMTAGAAAAITITFKALAEGGDEFLTFAPFFPEYRCFVESTGARLVVTPARTEDFQIDFEAFEKLLNAKTIPVVWFTLLRRFRSLRMFFVQRRRSTVTRFSLSPMSRIVRSHMTGLRFLILQSIMTILLYAIPIANPSLFLVSVSDISWCRMKLLISDRSTER